MDSQMGEPLKAKVGPKGKMLENNKGFPGQKLKNKTKPKQKAAKNKKNNILKLPKYMNKKEKGNVSFHS